jgi:hypothetical protein
MNFVPTKIDSTPGSVHFEGQPVDFDGTVAFVGMLIVAAHALREPASA